MKFKILIATWLLATSIWTYGQFDENTTVAEWKAEFDQLLYNENNLSALQSRANSDGSFQEHYYMYYHLHALWEMWRMTGDNTYLDIIIDTYYDAISSAVPVSWNSSYLGWPADASYGSDYPSNGSVLWESYWIRPVISTIRLMKDSPVLLGTSNGALPGSTYQDNYDDILAFVETHIWDKWYNKDLDEIYRGNTHMTSHWARIGLELFVITGEQKYKTVFDNISHDGMPAGGQSGTQGESLRGQIVVQGDGSYFWDSSWGCTPCGAWQDTAHASDLYAFWLIAYELGYEWTLADMQGFTKTMDLHWFPDDIGPNITVRIDGTQGNDAGKRMKGSAMYGRFDETLRARIISQYITHPSVRNWGNYGIDLAAYAAYGKFHSDGSTYAYPEPGGIAVTGVTWADDVQDIKAGETVDLSLVFAPSNASDQTYTLSSSNPSVLSNAGEFVNVGSATLTVTTNDGSFTDDMTVTCSATAVTGVQTSPSLFNILENGTVQLSATVFPDGLATDTSGTWASDNPSKATVNSSGLVTGASNGTGTANITFTTTDGSFVGTTVISIVDEIINSIEAISPDIFYSPSGISPGTADGGLMTTLQDNSGNGNDATIVDSVLVETSPRRVMQFNGGYIVPPSISALDLNIGVDSLVFIVREGPVPSADSGWLFSKVNTGPFTVEYGIAYGAGDLNGVYGGNTLTGFSNVPSGGNRLIIAEYKGSTVTVRIDGVEVLTDAPVGTTQSTGPVNIGGRTNGSYLMDIGSQLDLWVFKSGTITELQRTAIETEYILNLPPVISIAPSGVSVNGSDGNYVNINGQTIYIGN